MKRHTGKSVLQFTGEDTSAVLDIGVPAQAANNVHLTELYDYRQFGLRGDVDNSCAVDLFDVMAVTVEWGVTTFNPDVDLDLDDRISVRDIMLVTSRWGETCWD